MRFTFKNKSVQNSKGKDKKLVRFDVGTLWRVLSYVNQEPGYTN